MLFSATDSFSAIWQTLLHELHRGALDPKHPFRYLTVATVGEQFPQVRTVVMRQFTADLEFLVYTDARSSKVQELLEVPRVSLHFYHPKKNRCKYGSKPWPQFMWRMNLHRSIGSVSPRRGDPNTRANSVQALELRRLLLDGSHPRSIPIFQC